MITEPKNFDKEAATWDDEPRRVKLARDVAEAISAQVSLAPDMDALDFGCGSGLLTLHIARLVRSVTGVDSSQGMLDVLKAKIEKHNLSNVKAQLAKVEDGDMLQGNYHLIVTGMTLHHVRDIAPLLDQFYKVSAPGGRLCIADLDLDDGQFHSDNEGVFHYGFDREALRNAIESTGFDYVGVTTAAEIMKPLEDGRLRAFTVFLMTGRKRSDG